MIYAGHRDDHGCLLGLNLLQYDVLIFFHIYISNCTIYLNATAEGIEYLMTLKIIKIILSVLGVF